MKIIGESSHLWPENKYLWQVVIYSVNKYITYLQAMKIILFQYI